MLLMVLSLLTFLCSGTAQAQGIKIHQLGLGDGDCTLIEIIDYTPASTPTNPVFDTAVILIDAQRPKTYAAWEITEFIEARLGPKGLNRKIIDYVILSHVHIDHYGNMVKVLGDLLDEDYEISYVFDRLAFNVSAIDWDLNDVEDCYSDVAEPGKVSASASKYHKFIQDNFAGYNFPIRSGSELLEKRFANARMLCVAAYGATLDPLTGKDAFFIPHNGKIYKPKSENDLSFAFLLSYKGFRYFTGGDLGGQDHSGYANGEVPVARYLKAKGGTNFHFCAFKVSHHGSEESSAPAFLTLVNPSLAVIPASLRTYGSSTNPLPRCNTLDNLAARVSKMVFTFQPNGDQKKPSNYCKYNNLSNTQDVSLAVNFADVGDTITMRLSFQPRNKNFDPVGTPTLEDFKCTKPHSKGPFSAAVQVQGMMQVMDSTAVNNTDSLQGQANMLPAPQVALPPLWQEPEVREPSLPKKKTSAKNRKKKKKKQHNH